MRDKYSGIQVMIALNELLVVLTEEQKSTIHALKEQDTMSGVVQRKRLRANFDLCKDVLEAQKALTTGATFTASEYIKKSTGTGILSSITFFEHTSEPLNVSFYPLMEKRLASLIGFVD